ncbi:MAG: hybrid sensor histidine kinase/response regulator [Aureliella sp.]
MGKLLAKVDLQAPLEALARRLGWPRSVAVVLHYAIPSLILVAAIELVHYSALARPASDMFLLAVLILGSWFGRTGPALLLSPTLFTLSRISRPPAERFGPTDPEEFMGLLAVSLICVSVALVGQFRRRVRAVTEQNAARLEDQARALSLATILFRDIHGQITQWNEGAQRLFGWTSDEAIGQTVQELLQSRFPQPLEQVQAELTRAGQWHGEAVYRHKDGTELHVATHCILSRDKAGNPIGVAEVHNDVTALRRAEAAVREADRRKDEFLAVLAHELRNPLAPIRTGLELMRTMPDDPKLIEETRSIMERQTRQLVTLVDDLLDISRISRGKLELRRSSVALSEIVQSAVEAATPIIRASGHCLSVALPETPVYLHADPNRLAQVLSNLLDNSAKYMPAGGRIGLTAERADDTVVLSIKDTGIGIPTDMLERIFDMFTRTQLTDVDHGGLGIGLALVKSIVEMHEGRIEAYSEGPGQGAQFKITLPVLAQASVEAPTADDACDLSDSGKHRVLIVDDNQSAAHLLGILVANIGNEVRLAYDGEQAIQIAREFSPEIVLMDLGMPRLDGYDACRYIREQPWGRDIVLVALTGWGQDSHRQRAKECGFDHHLVKPADPAELRRIFADAQSQRCRLAQESRRP